MSLIADIIAAAEDSRDFEYVDRGEPDLGNVDSRTQTLKTPNVYVEPGGVQSVAGRPREAVSVMCVMAASAASWDVEQVDAIVQDLDELLDSVDDCYQHLRGGIAVNKAFKLTEQGQPYVVAIVGCVSG